MNSQIEAIAEYLYLMQRAGFDHTNWLNSRENIHGFYREKAKELIVLIQPTPDLTAYIEKLRIRAMAYSAERYAVRSVATTVLEIAKELEAMQSKPQEGK